MKHKLFINNDLEFIDLVSFKPNILSGEEPVEEWPLKPKE